MSQPAPDPDTQQQQQIRQTRSELGQTVAALTAKVQLRARARDKAARMADLARNSAAVSQVGRAATAVRQHRRPALVAAVVVMVGTLAATAIMVRRRRPHRPSCVTRRPSFVCRRR